MTTEAGRHAPTPSSPPLMQRHALAAFVLHDHARAPVIQRLAVDVALGGQEFDVRMLAQAVELIDDVPGQVLARMHAVLGHQIKQAGLQAVDGLHRGSILGIWIRGLNHSGSPEQVVVIVADLFDGARIAGQQAGLRVCPGGTGQTGLAGEQIEFTDQAAGLGAAGLDHVLGPDRVFPQQAADFIRGPLDKVVFLECLKFFSHASPRARDGALSVPRRILEISKNHYYYIDGLVKCFFWILAGENQALLGLPLAFLRRQRMKGHSGAPEAGIAKAFARDKARLCIDYLINSEFPWGFWKLELQNGGERGIRTLDTG